MKQFFVLEPMMGECASEVRLNHADGTAMKTIRLSGFMNVIR